MSAVNDGLGLELGGAAYPEYTGSQTGMPVSKAMLDAHCDEVHGGLRIEKRCLGSCPDKK